MELNKEEIRSFAESINSHCLLYGMSGNVGNLYFEANYGGDGAHRVTMLHVQLGHDEFVRDIDPESIEGINNYLRQL
jgi:hypothetical protein